MTKKKRTRRMRRGRLALLIALPAFLAAGVGTTFWLYPIHFSRQAYSAQLGQAYSVENAIAWVFGASKDDVIVTGTIDILQVGTYPLTFHLGSREQTIEVQVADRKAPVLSVHDVQAAEDEEVDADSFITSLQDDSRVSVTILNPEALQNKSGIQIIELQAQDEYGNITRKQARLIRNSETESETESVENATTQS